MKVLINSIKSKDPENNLSFIVDLTLKDSKDKGIIMEELTKEYNWLCSNVDKPYAQLCEASLKNVIAKSNDKVIQGKIIITELDDYKVDNTISILV